MKIVNVVIQLEQQYYCKSDDVRIKNSGSRKSKNSGKDIPQILVTENKEKADFPGLQARD